MFDGVYSKEGFQMSSHFMVEHLEPLIGVNVVGAVREYEHQDAFKLYHFVDGERFKTPGTYHLDIVARPTARERALNFKSFKELFLVPMVDALVVAINKLPVDDYLMIELSMPEVGLGTVVSINDVYARIVAGYNMKYCSSELSIDVAFITKDAYKNLS